MTLSPRALTFAPEQSGKGHDVSLRAKNSDHPANRLLLVGAIDSTTNYVEHPEVVADRLERAARALGDPQRIIAATDCGFEITVGLSSVAEELVWEKLRALRDSAAIASRRLFG